MNEEYGILYQYYRNTELPLVIKLILDGSIMLVDLLLTLHVILLVLIFLRVLARHDMTAPARLAWMVILFLLP